MGYAKGESGSKLKRCVVERIPVCDWPAILGDFRRYAERFVIGGVTV